MVGAPFFVLGVERFGDSVGVGNDDIPGLQRNGFVLDRPVKDIGFRQSDRNAFGINRNGRAVSAFFKQQPFMPGPCEFEFAGAGVENHIEHGDEHVFGEVFAEHAVELAEHARGALLLRGAGAQNALTDGHHHGSADAFSRHVGNGDSEMFVIDADKVVIVAADIKGGQVVGGDIHMVDLRKLLGEE